MKKNKGIILIILLLSILTTACSAKSTADRAENSMGMAPQASEEMKEEASDNETGMDGEIDFGGAAPRKNKDQKLIYRASRHIEVTQKLEPLIVSLQDFIESHNGYIENMEQYRYGYDPVAQEQLDGIIMRIRIPHEHYSKALANIDELGAVINKSSSVEDVTLQYSDIESTLKMYKVEQGRLLEMMESGTTDVKDMIEIEKRLSEVRIEIEKQESARRALESQINYDTIDLEINQVRTVSNINETKSFGSRIKAAFIKSIDNVKVSSQELVIGITYMLIPLSILIIIIGFAYVVITKIIRIIKNRRKLSKKQEKNDEKV